MRRIKVTWEITEQFSEVIEVDADIEVAAGECFGEIDSILADLEEPMRTAGVGDRRITKLEEVGE